MRSLEDIGGHLPPDRNQKEEDCISRNGRTLISNTVMYDRRLSPSEKLLYFELVRRVNNKSPDFCWPTVRRLAEAIALSERQVIRCLAHLEDLGFIQKVPQGRFHGYRIMDLHVVYETCMEIPERLQEILWISNKKRKKLKAQRATSASPVHPTQMSPIEDSTTDIHVTHITKDKNTLYESRKSRKEKCVPPAPHTPPSGGSAFEVTPSPHSSSHTSEEEITYEDYEGVDFEDTLEEEETTTRPEEETPTRSGDRVIKTAWHLWLFHLACCKKYLPAPLQRLLPRKPTGREIGQLKLLLERETDPLDFIEGVVKNWEEASKRLRDPIPSPRAYLGMREYLLRWKQERVTIRRDEPVLAICGTPVPLVREWRQNRPSVLSNGQHGQRIETRDGRIYEVRYGDFSRAWRRTADPVEAPTLSAMYEVVR